MMDFLVAHGKDNPRNSEGSLIRLKNGKLFFVYSRYTGTDWHDDCSADIASIFSENDGKTWSKPQILLQNQGMNIMSASLLRLQDGRIAMVALYKNAITGTRETDCRPKICFSSDEAESWTEPKDITPVAAAYLVVNNDRLIQLKSGRLILPATQHDYTGSKGFVWAPGVGLFFLSDDGGATWRQAKGRCLPPPWLDRGLMEPGTVELSDGRIFAWFRTRGGCQYQAWSLDQGETWTAPIPAQQFPGPEAPLSLKPDPENGDLVAVWNDYHPARSVKFQDGILGRTPLVLARSSDNGKTWKGHLVLEDAPNHGYAYTAMLFDRGKLFLAYCCGGLDTCECMLQDMKIRSLSAEECGRTFVKGNAEADLQCIREHLTGAKKEPWTWLFYGDSITHGAAHTCGWRSFPEIFGERVRWELRLTWDVVINTAISGNSTAELTNPLQYEWLVRCRKPNVVMVLIGTNDIIKLDDIDLFRENLTRLVRWIRIDGAIPILQTYGTIQKIPENRNYVKRLQEMPAYNDAIRKTAAAEDVILIDHDLVWQKEAADPDVLAAWLGEPIHPGAKGHLEYGKEIFRKLDIFDPKCGCCNPVGVPFSIPPRP